MARSRASFARFFDAWKQTRHWWHVSRVGQQKTRRRRKGELSLYFSCPSALVLQAFALLLPYFNRAFRTDPDSFDFTSICFNFAMPSLTGATRLAFLIFFASHIPITLLMNGQTVLPEVLFPDALRGILPFYAAQFNDTLMTAPFDTWFQSFVVCEVFLQVPFFIYAVKSLMNWQSTDGSGWFRTACLLYGAHAVTTLIPILAETIFNNVNTPTEKCILYGFYIPYLIFPSYLVYIAATNDTVFSEPLIKAKVA